MTREEAIKILSKRDGHGIPSGYNGGYAEAIEVAIEALKAEPIKHGHWITKALSAEQSIDDLPRLISKCSVCGKKLQFVTLATQMPYKFCPNCGSRMNEVKE